MQRRGRERSAGCVSAQPESLSRQLRAALGAELGGLQRTLRSTRGVRGERLCASSVEAPFATDAQATLVRVWQADWSRATAAAPFACSCEHAGVSRLYDVSAEDAPRD